MMVVMWCAHHEPMSFLALKTFTIHHGDMMPVEHQEADNVETVTKISSNGIENVSHPDTKRHV